MQERRQSSRNKGYNGNPLIPKAGTKKELTAEQVLEFEKCYNDPVYFANTYFRIVHQKHGLVQMKLYDYQNEALEIFQEKGKLIMATARQVGKTSLATVLILHTALFNKHKNIALLANRKTTAKEVLNRIQTAYEYLPEWLKGGVKEWNKESVEFENGCKIFADATTGNSIRGKSIYLLYIDEFAFIENYDDFSAAVMPTVSSNDEAKIIFTSTPNGLNHFWGYCESAREKKSDFGYIEVPWYKVEGRDEAWRERTLSEMNYDFQRFAQEQEVEFQGSSGTLISGATLKRLSHQRPIQSDNKLFMYKQVEEGHQYVISADVSRGKGLDSSAFHVLDVTTVPYHQVCVYRNNMINPIDYSHVIDRLSRHYNNAVILVENNNMGSQVCDVLFLELNNDGVLSTENKGRGGKQISDGYGKTAERGVNVSKPVRNQGCSMMKLLVEQFKVILNDKETIEELKTFSLKGDKYQAEEGKHDDLVMALLIFSWMSDQDYFKQLIDKDIRDHLAETSQEELDDMLLVFGLVDDGLDQAHLLEPGDIPSIPIAEWAEWFNT